MKTLVGFLLGCICSLTIVFGVGVHGKWLSSSAEFIVCSEYRICYSFEWANCDKNGHNCDNQDFRWYVDFGGPNEAKLDFLGVYRR